MYFFLKKTYCISSSVQSISDFPFQVSWYVAYGKAELLEELHGYYVGVCLVTQSCLTLCDPVDCSPPGCSVHGISQAVILEWVAVPFSRGSSRPRDGTRVSCVSCICRWILYRLSYQGSPQMHTRVYVSGDMLPCFNLSCI